MSPVALFLVTIAAIFMIGALGEIVFRRTQVPDVVWLLLVGIVLGPVTGVVGREQLTAIAPYFGALTLVVVLFEGGSRLNLLEISRAAPRSGLLAVLTFGVAAVAVAGMSGAAAAAGWLPREWTWTHSILLGVILGGSSSIIIMPAMLIARVRPGVANLVNLESAFTDAFCVVGAAAIIDFMLQTGAAGAASPGLALARSFGLGIAIGIVTGFLWLLFLRLLHAADHAYSITLAALLLLYVLIDRAGGSAALGILGFAVVVGNASLIGHRLGLGESLALSPDVRGFNLELTFIIKSFFFTFMGAMLGPPWSLVALGALLGLVLLPARIPAVRLALVGSRLEPGERRLVTVAMPRGMAAGVMASMPAAAGVPGTADLPNIVFSAALVTVLVFAVGFPFARRRAAPGPAPVPPHVLPGGGVGPPASPVSMEVSGPEPRDGAPKEDR